MIDRDMVSKAEVLDIYAELYDEFDDAPGIIKVLHKVCDKLKRLQPQEPVVSPTIGGWISVKERLPEKNQIVIASDGEHTWDVGMYKSLCGKPSMWNWKKNTVKTVLWWMPKDGALPEPPKT